jgi:hypothetical protein
MESPWWRLAGLPKRLYTFAAVTGSAPSGTAQNVKSSS